MTWAVHTLASFGLGAIRSLGVRLTLIDFRAWDFVWPLMKDLQTTRLGGQ